MADLFPGTEIEVFEKYPDSRRLDHPDFANVAKTIFAKGKISDFKKISEDPLTVAPMVKVTFEGGMLMESGYVPLFFQPKEKYWDTDEAEARDYDEGSGAFKNAWMSFRGDDEVAVLLQGDPVAVMGFADGNPRIGESVFQMEYFTIGGTSKVCQWQPQVQGVATEKIGKLYGNFNQENLGPDGVDLGLATEAELVCDTGEQEGVKTTHIETYYNHYVYDPESGHGFEVLPITIDQSYTVTRSYKEYFFTIGPIAYVLQVLSNKLHTVITYSAAGQQVYQFSDPANPTTIENIDSTTYANEISILSKLYSDDIRDEAIAKGSVNSGLVVLDPSNPTPYPDWVDYFDLDYDIESDNPDWDYDQYPLNFGHRGVVWDGWYFNPDFSVRLMSAVSQSDNTSTNQMDAATLKIYTRPHTKTELEAASMWPGE